MQRSTDGERTRRFPRPDDVRPSARRLLLGAALGMAGLSAFVAVSSGLPGSGPDLQDVAAAGTAAPTSSPAPAWGLSAGAPAGAVTLPAAPVVATAPEPADDGTVTGLAANGIPNVALNAYRVAAARMAASDPGCAIDWSLVAGIGRVESNHGRFAGAVLNPDGTSTPAIKGPALDGVQFAFITDTDGGRWDGDTSHDRAVGPMQFIPSTWRSYAVDADGSGVADPFDIDDESLAAAHYLCVAGGDLSTDAGQRRAVLAYNHSDSYVAQVLALAHAYAAGIPVADLPLVGDTSSPVPAPSGDYTAPAAPGPAIGAGDRTASPAGEATVAGAPQPAPAADPAAGQPADPAAPAAGGGTSGSAGTSGGGTGSGGGGAPAVTQAPAPQPAPALPQIPAPTTITVPVPTLPLPSLPVPPITVPGPICVPTPLTHCP